MKATAKLVKNSNAVPYEIDDDIPVSRYSRENPLRDFISEMDVNDSFLMGNNPKEVTRVSSTVRAYGVKNDRTFTIRKTKDGYRCWRIK